MGNVFVAFTRDWFTNYLPEFIKVGDNSYPNLMPLLTGKRGESESADMPAELPDLQGKKCDGLPLIWRQFAAKGYATTFNEDNFGMGTFHYPRGGFSQQPSTFFYRNFWRMVEQVRKRHSYPEYAWTLFD